MTWKSVLNMNTILIFLLCVIVFPVCRRFSSGGSYAFLVGEELNRRKV